jgi:dihydroorotate dehydrogenase (NAD+) catalytic subunit
MISYKTETPISLLDQRASELSIDMSTCIAGITLKNPVLTASGTFSPRESGAFYDIGELGAAVTKGISSVPWAGNDTPRIAEVYGGMLNSIGLQNPGVDYYIREELPYLSQFNTPVIANVAGHSIDEYCDVIEKLNETAVTMFEVNISCPNVSKGGIGFGTDPQMAAEVTKAVKRISKKPVIIKLTPNVTDITEIARAVEAEGADAVSLINTLLGMHIDVARRKATLAMKTGGMSGPAVKPIALRMVYQVCKVVSIPVIGLGGISSGTDAVEFIAAGASAIAVGTAALVNPTAPVEIKSQIIDYMSENGFKTLQDIRNAFTI